MCFKTKTLLSIISVMLTRGNIMIKRSLLPKSGWFWCAGCCPAQLFCEIEADFKMLRKGQRGFGTTVKE